MSTPEERARRWQLILGQQPEGNLNLPAPLAEEDQEINELLNDFFEENQGSGKSQGGTKGPYVPDLLERSRRIFPKSVVEVLEKEALERFGLAEFARDPEALRKLQPDVRMVGNLLGLRQHLQPEVLPALRELVEKLIAALQTRIGSYVETELQAHFTALQRRRSVHGTKINWPATVRKNLKHWQPKEQLLIPEHFVREATPRKQWHELVLCVDQSGSMGRSVIYASVYAAALSHLPSLHTRVLCFSTEIEDVSDAMQDPVSFLLGLQLGGGTHIAPALHEARRNLQQPEKALVVLISDLFEGRSMQEVVNEALALKQAGAKVLCLLALDDEGTPTYNSVLAHSLRQIEVLSFAATPEEFPEILRQHLEV